MTEMLSIRNPEPRREAGSLVLRTYGSCQEDRNQPRTLDPAERRHRAEVDVSLFPLHWDEEVAVEDVIVQVLQRLRGM